MVNFHPSETEPSKEGLEYTVVTSPEELDMLEGRQSSYENLNFGFSSAYLQELKDQLNNSHAFQLIAKEGGKFAGYVAASESLFPDYLYLRELFVEPQFSGQGIASDLVNQVIDFAKQEDLQGVYTQTEQENIPAQNLYEKLGFERVNNPEWEGVTYKLEFEELSEI